MAMAFGQQLAALVAFALVLDTATGQAPFESPCDLTRNANLPFCNSALPINSRVSDLLTRLTLDEKIGLLDHTSAGASVNVDLTNYTWWNEGLHGLALSPGVHFYAPTPAATSFPQPINLAAAFNKQLFFEMGNATGNEARAFFNVGNAGLTYWGPNNNIYRDPRWGRGHETPGECPRLSAEFAKAYIRGMQGGDRDERPGGFLKSSACCKHFAAHSQEEDRFAFNSVVTEQDMADTYLPAFKACVEEADVSCIMCAYNAVNGIPACAHRDLLTGLVRETWGFDGCITTDCGGVEHIKEKQNYTQTEADSCAVVLNAGVDLECHHETTEYGIFAHNLGLAIDDGKVSMETIDGAVGRLTRVLMRLGWFEKEATRPYKDLLPPGSVDTPAHQALALQAARESIVLLKNAPSAQRGTPTLPLDPLTFKMGSRAPARRASMALIGPYIDGAGVDGPWWDGGFGWLGNYHGLPPFVKQPVDEFRKYVPDLEAAIGCAVLGFNDSGLDAAVQLARDSEQVVLFVGITSSSYNIDTVEREGKDRANLTLTGLQTELIRRVLAVVRTPVILVAVSGGALDLSEWESDPRVGAILWAGYIGQAAGEAIADVLFGLYNPSGRLPQTFYYDDYVRQIAKDDMAMRPNVGAGYPGRTYRFFTGEALYPFGYGLSYTTFNYGFEDSDAMMTTVLPKMADECSIQLNVSVRNTGTRSGAHSVLWYISPPGAGVGGRPLKTLLDFEKTAVLLPLQSAQVSICLNRDHFQLANADGEWEVVTGQWRLSVGDLERTILVT